MIIYKWPDRLDDHLQETDPPDDHLQEAGSPGLSFAAGQSLQMIICKWIYILLCPAPK